MNLSELPRRFPQFGKSIRNVVRTREQVFRCDKGPREGECGCSDKVLGNCGCGKGCNGSYTRRSDPAVTGLRPNARMARASGGVTVVGKSGGVRASISKSAHLVSQERNDTLLRRESSDADGEIPDSGGEEPTCQES